MSRFRQAARGEVLEPLGSTEGSECRRRWALPGALPLRRKYSIAAIEYDDCMSTAPSDPALTQPVAVPKKGGEEYYWLWVMCLLGLDYFSTLAYQPSITFHETKLLGPLATAGVVLLTLFGALPVYCYLAARSPGGQGSLGILDKLIRGWRGKTLVLILLGFAATDFTMLKSLSLADAAVHTLNKQDSVRLENAKHITTWMKDCTAEYCGDEASLHVSDQLIVTLLLGIVAMIFWFLLRRGFTRKVMYVAVPLVALYLIMTAIIVVAGLYFLYQVPHIVTAWFDNVMAGKWDHSGIHHGDDGWGLIIVMSLLALPNLALGLSGFEMSMILMPQVQGKADEQPPRTRIGNTRKVLIAAALIMSVLLLGSAFVTTLLVPYQELARKQEDLPPGEMFAREGHANDRALSYLAHGGDLAVPGEKLTPFFGIEFGTAYDIVTVLILCLAGTSVMTALGVYVPLFLVRFGMQMKSAERWGVLLLLFAGINILVTVWFKAQVEDQRGAYATGVLVMIACAAGVTVLDKRKAYAQAPHKGAGILHFIDMTFHGLIAAVFVVVMFFVAIRSPSGLGIALFFIAAILGMSIVSRAWRADELRTPSFLFKDPASEEHWHRLRLTDFPALVPVRPGRQNHVSKETHIRATHQLSAGAEVVFLEVCIDDPSDFLQTPIIEVTNTDFRYTIGVTNCVSTAHAIAAVALVMSRESKPPALHFGWPENSILAASWSYLAFGEGNVPWKVRELIHRAEADATKRPRVIVG